MRAICDSQLSVIITNVWGNQLKGTFVPVLKALVDDQLALLALGPCQRSSPWWECLGSTVLTSYSGGKERKRGKGWGPPFFLKACPQRLKDLSLGPTSSSFHHFLIPPFWGPSLHTWAFGGHWRPKLYILSSFLLSLSPEVEQAEGKPDYILYVYKKFSWINLVCFSHHIVNRVGVPWP